MNQWQQRLLQVKRKTLFRSLILILIGGGIVELLARITHNSLFVWLDWVDLFMTVVFCILLYIRQRADLQKIYERAESGESDDGSEPLSIQKDK